MEYTPQSPTLAKEHVGALGVPVAHCLHSARLEPTVKRHLQPADNASLVSCLNQNPVLDGPGFRFIGFLAVVSVQYGCTGLGFMLGMCIKLSSDLLAVAYNCEMQYSYAKTETAACFSLVLAR